MSGNWGYLIKRPSGRQDVNILIITFVIYLKFVIKKLTFKLHLSKILTSSLKMSKYSSSNTLEQ
jgi:hypothetical protein